MIIKLIKTTRTVFLPPKLLIDSLVLLCSMIERFVWEVHLITLTVLMVLKPTSHVIYKKLWATKI